MWKFPSGVTWLLPSPHDLSRFVYSCQWGLERSHHLEMCGCVMSPHVTHSIASLSSLGHTTRLLPDSHNLTYNVYTTSPHHHHHPFPVPQSAPHFFLSPPKYQVLPLCVVWAQHWGMRVRCWTDYWPRETTLEWSLTAAFRVQGVDGLGWQPIPSHFLMFSYDDRPIWACLCV